MFNQDLLRPGDCLLYNPNGIFGWLIAVKTWHRFSHTEIYLRDGYSVASRDGVGVNSYPFREPQLAAVYRPTTPFNLTKSVTWFLTEARGQGYDWWGLLRFTWRSDYSHGNENNKQFCSEFATRFYRKGGLDPFPGEDADAVPPFYFSISPLFTKVWSDR